MKVNFDKSDRLIELIEDSCLALSEPNFWGAYQLKHSENPVIRNLYSELVEMTHSDISEEEKNLQRINSFANAYGHKNDLEFGERMLKRWFDENRTIEQLTRAYWQIQPFVIFVDETGNNFSDTDKLRQLIEKRSPDEPCKEVMIDVIRKLEPDVKSIETEFWANCTEADQINNWCNIYRERFNNHIKEVDEKFYEDVFCGFDESNKYHQYFKELLLTGLLRQREVDIKSRLWHVAKNINIVSNKIVKLFKGLRASTQNTISNNNSIPENENLDKSQTINLNTDEVKVDHSDLLNALSKYVTGITPVEFTNIIEHHSLTPGTLPATWIGSAIDAHRFTSFLNLKLPDFDKCFKGIKTKDGKDRGLRHSDVDKNDRQFAPILKILRTHLNK